MTGRSAPRRLLVTGAAQGIGRAIAHQLAGAGATLALLDRNESALTALAGELGPTHVVRAVDLRDTDRTATRGR